jgi:hypothetical protein
MSTDAFADQGRQLHADLMIEGLSDTPADTETGLGVFWSQGSIVVWFYFDWEETKNFPNVCWYREIREWLGLIEIVSVPLRARMVMQSGGDWQWTVLDLLR